MLGDHQDKREIVHSQCSVEERFRINKKYDVLDGVFNYLWVGFCKQPLASLIVCSIKKTNLVDATEVPTQLHDLVVILP